MGFKRLDAEDFVVSADAVQSVAWSTGAPTLTDFYSSSVQEAGSSGDYYLSVYQTASTLTEAAVQFDIAYADKEGSGSNYFGDSTNIITGSNFWVLSVERARYKEKLFPGTFNLTLKGMDSSNGFRTVKLTDNSNDVSTQTFLGSNRVLQIVSGSNGSAFGTTGFVANSGSYGLFLPDIGTILLNPAALSHSIDIRANTTADLSSGTNQKTLFTAIHSGSSFELNAEETITSDYIFVRSRNAEFNYSENPSFISGSTGEVIFDSFINSPQVYVTTIGLYNDSNELIAVAKLSKPLLKDFTKESLVRVKLDF